MAIKHFTSILFISSLLLSGLLSVVADPVHQHTTCFIEKVSVKSSTAEPLSKNKIDHLPVKQKHNNYLLLDKKVSYFPHLLYSYLDYQYNYHLNNLLNYQARLKNALQHQQQISNKIRATSKNVIFNHHTDLLEIEIPQHS